MRTPCEDHLFFILFSTFQFEYAKLKMVIGQEDCLVLNVYVPETDPASSGPLPVMVFIHGGGFFLGSSSNRLYGPERFMDHGVASYHT